MVAEENWIEADMPEETMQLDRGPEAAREPVSELFTCRRDDAIATWLSKVEKINLILL